jgi:hypothetical protein
LSFGDTWNHTASPCNELVGAFIESPSLFHGGGGVLDRAGLTRCVRWRKAGRDLINALNLTSMMAGCMGGVAGRVDCCSHVFMSVLDFVSVVARNKGAGEQMFAHLPKVVACVMNASEGFRPVAELIGTAQQHAIMMYVEHLLLLHQQGDSEAGNSSSQQQQQKGVPRPESIINTTLARMDEQTRRMALRFFWEHTRDVSLFYVYSNSIVGAGRGPLSRAGAGPESEGAVNDGVQAAGGRRLLQASLSNGNIVDSYSSLVADGNLLKEEGYHILMQMIESDLFGWVPCPYLVVL